MTATPTLFHWHRPVPTAWAEEIARLSPKFDRLSHLVLFWEPGFPDDPVQRWVLYDAVPVAYVPQWKRDAFNAERLCECPVVPTRIEHCEKCAGLVSPGRKRALQYLRETECLPFPFWVIQGEQGGHPYRYTQVEVNWAKLLGQPGEPPQLGSLPYADFDQRVIRKLRAYDRTRTAFSTLLAAEAHQRKEAEIAFRTALAAYVDNAVEAAFDELPMTRRAALIDAIPRDPTQDRVPLDLAAATDAFIQGEDS